MQVNRSIFLFSDGNAIRVERSRNRRFVHHVFVNGSRKGFVSSAPDETTAMNLYRKHVSTAPAKIVSYVEEQ